MLLSEENNELDKSQGMFLSTVPPQLVELEIPGRTGPVPSGEWGVNLAAARENFPRQGLQLFVPAWPNMGRGDSVAVLLEGTEVVRKPIAAEEVGLRQTLFIDPNRLSNGSTSVNYKVTRLGQVPEESAATAVLIKLDRPGGQDQNGSEPGHSELKLNLPQEIIENGVDKAAAARGVIVTISPYPFMAEHDQIRVTWGGQIVTHVVALAEVDKSIAIKVEEATILAAGDSGSDGLAVAFEVYDLVDNQSEDWSAEIRVVVDTENSRLAAGILQESVNNVLDLDTLGDAPATLRITADRPDFIKGDQIIVRLTGTRVDGEPVDITYPVRDVDNIPHVYDITVPNADVRQLAKTQGVFSYRLKKVDGSFLQAKGRFVSIIGEPAQLAAPLAQDAQQGSLDPQLPVTTIEVPWDDSMAAGQVIDLKWYGIKPDTSVYFPELTPHDITNGEESARQPIFFYVDGSHLVAIEGGTLELYYELVPEDGSSARRSLSSPKFIVGEPRAELPAPSVPDAQDDVLDPETLPPSGTRLIVKRYTGIAIGDELHFSWKGSVTGLFEDWIKITQNNVSRPEFPLAIALDKIKGDLGGTVTASYWVSRQDGKVSQSDPLTLQIGQAQQLPAPEVAEANANGVIDPNTVTAGATVVIGRTAELVTGDKVRVVLTGKVGDTQTHTVSTPGEQRFKVPYAVITANENSSIVLQYHVLRGGAGPEEPSPSAEFDVRVIAGSGQLKLLGARFNRSTYRSSGSPRYLHAFHAVSGQPLLAEWKYSSDAQWTVTNRWRDTQPHLPLQVRTLDDQLTLNPANIIGSGSFSSLSGNAAFVAHRDDGRVRGWGHPDFGANIGPAIMALNDIVEVSCTSSAYAIRRIGGVVMVWGDVNSGGNMGSVSPDNFAAVVGNGMAFAGIKTSGQVVAWGGADIGGTVPEEIGGYTDITKVVGGTNTFAALRKSGQVVAWGVAENGGTVPRPVAALTDIIDIGANYRAFAALRGNGSVVAWGDANYGGDAKSVANFTDIVEISSASSGAFVAKRASGHIVAWGNRTHGGDLPQSIADLTDIIDVTSTWFAFAAVRANGSVVVWGGAQESGGVLPDEIAELTDVVQVASSSRAFALLRRNGTVMAWGDKKLGGDTTPVRADLVDVQAIYSNTNGFVALRRDGRVVAWGHAKGGGDNSAIREELDGFVSYRASSATRGRALSAQRVISATALVD